MELRPCPLSERSHHPALLTDTFCWSYAECDARVQRVVQHLKAQGVAEGNRVAFVAVTHPSTVLLFFALFRLRAVACPLSTRLPSEQIPCYLQRLKHTHWVDPVALPVEPLTSNTSATIDLDAQATLLFTSGSSGTPKIARHSLGNHYSSALTALDALELDPSSHYLLSLPLFHVSGIAILLRTWLCGGTLCFSQTAPITHLSMVPTQLYRLLQTKQCPPEHLRCVLLGGAPASLQLLERAHHWPVHTTYGLTETSSMMTLNGFLLPERELQIRGQEIYVRGPTLFQGYLDTPQEGWFATRDLGQFNAQGRLEILGRKDRQFISGGENIQPEEIERALCTLPGILAAHVRPLEDPEFGHRPLAFIQDTTGQHTLETLRAALEPLLPSFKHPVQIHPWLNSNYQKLL